MKGKSAILAAAAAVVCAAAFAAGGASRVVAKILNERSAQGHNMAVGVLTSVDLSKETGGVSVEYEIRVDSVHAGKPLSDDWIRLVVNGNARVWGDGGKDVRIAGLSCGSGDLAEVVKPGTWYKVSHALPADKLPGRRLTKFEVNLYNDTGRYSPRTPDGIKWSNDEGVKLSIRNARIVAAP